MSNKVSLEDITVQRDESGQIQPKTVYVDELNGEVDVRPMSRADRKKYLSEIFEPEDTDKELLPDEVLAEMITKLVVTPDLTEHPRCPDNEVSPEFLQNELDPQYEMGLFYAILLASGDEEVVDEFRRIESGDLTEEERKRLEEGQEGNQTAL